MNKDCFLYRGQWRNIRIFVSVVSKEVMFILLNLITVQLDATVFSLLHFCRQLYMFLV
jgi:hypothetical protein